MAGASKEFTFFIFGSCEPFTQETLIEYLQERTNLNSGLTYSIVGQSTWSDLLTNGTD